MDFSKKTIVIFELLTVYAVLLFIIKDFFHVFLFLFMLVAIDNITPIQNFQQF